VRRALLGIAALAALASGTARADEVEFRNGRVLEGTVVSETEATVTLRIEGGQVTFDRGLVASIRRAEKPAPGKPAAAAPVPGFTAKPAEPVGVTPAADDWLLLWSPERRAGWRRCEARVGEDGRCLFEEQSTWLGRDGKPEGTERYVEECGANFAPSAFLLISEIPGKTFTRTGRVAGGRLTVETWEKGEKSERVFEVPAGLRFPLAARTLVLRESARDGAAWKGTAFDPRAAEMASTGWRVLRREKAPFEGATVETVILSRESGGRTLEERVAADGRLLAADLDGAGLAAVGSTKARVEALRDGAALEEATEAEQQGRTSLVSPEDGFRIRKPGVSWSLVPPASRDARERAAVRDVTGAVTVVVASDPQPAGPEPEPKDLLPALEERLKATATEYVQVEAGPSTLGGCPAWRVVADAVVKGDKVRIQAVTLARAGRAWTVVATAPRATWDEARPYLQRILDGIEWL
jgi:hypothetical protein